MILGRRPWKVDVVHSTRVTFWASYGLVSYLNSLQILCLMSIMHTVPTLQYESVRESVGVLAPAPAKRGVRCNAFGGVFHPSPDLFPLPPKMIKSAGSYQLLRKERTAGAISADYGE